jgi:O-antigen/teichoic acid export membrane protein
MKLPRFQSHVMVTISAWASRVVIAAVQLVAVRILIQNLGTDKYAIITLFNGLGGWYLLADLGMGYSIQNFVSEYRSLGKDDRQLILLSGCICFLLFGIEAIVLVLSSGWLGSTFLHQFTFLSAVEKRSLFLAASLMLIGTGIGAVSYRIWYGQHRGYIANIVPAIGVLGGLGGVWLVGRLNAESRLYWTLIAFLIPNTVVALAGLLTQVSRQWQPMCLWLDWGMLRRMVSRASHFWIFALLSAGVLQVDYVVISQVLPPEQIVAYSVATRVFLFVGLIYSSALFAVWPVFTELTTIHAWQPVIRNLRNYILAGTAFVLLCTAGLVIKMSSIAHILSPNHHIEIPYGLILLLGAYYIIRVWTDSFATVLQSMSDLKPLWTAVAIQAILSTLLEWKLAVKWGPYGVVSGLILSYLLTVAWWIPVKVLQHRNNAPVKCDAEAIYLHSNI